MRPNITATPAALADHVKGHKQTSQRRTGYTGSGEFTKNDQCDEYSSHYCQELR